MTVHQIKITRPDEDNMAYFWKLYNAASRNDNRWGGWNVQDIAEELKSTDLDRKQKLFLLRAWQVLVDDQGGFGRLMSAYDTYVINMQDPEQDVVAWKPEIIRMSEDADLLPVLLEAYEEALLETRRPMPIGELIQRLEEQTGQKWAQAPHHNGMMQLSNELADAKAALRRLSMYARTFAGNIQYTGDHPIAVAEKIAGRDDFFAFGNRIDNQSDHATPLSIVGTAPPAPVSVPDDLEMKPILTAEGQIVGYEYQGERYGVTAGCAWNTAIRTFRSAMLQGAEPVTTAYKLPANTPCKEAPEHIWLQTAGAWPENGEFSELTWCSDNQHEDDTLYVRADVVTGNSPVIPDGWVMVPIEPTEQMIMAAGPNCPDAFDYLRTAYKDIIAAAPAHSCADGNYSEPASEFKIVDFGRIDIMKSDYLPTMKFFLSDFRIISNEGMNNKGMLLSILDYVKEQISNPRSMNYVDGTGNIIIKPRDTPSSSQQEVNQ